MISETIILPMTINGFHHDEEFLVQYTLMDTKTMVRVEEIHKLNDSSGRCWMEMVHNCEAFMDSICSEIEGI